MSRFVLLDAGPLGLITNPNRSPQSRQCAEWVQLLLRTDTRVVIPEIADYEVRRELLRANKTKGLERLDSLMQKIDYLPITTIAMRQAAQFWAEARQRGYPTAPDLALDGDVILAAQAVTLDEADTVIATTNVGHLSRFTLAKEWQYIR